jgi:hypothetical protein
MAQIITDFSLKQTTYFGEMPKYLCAIIFTFPGAEHDEYAANAYFPEGKI